MPGKLWDYDLTLWYETYFVSRRRNYGLVKERSIDLNSLDETTRAALISYFDNHSNKPPQNYNETWSLNDEKEVSIDTSKMSTELKQLYIDMKKNSGY